METFEAQLDDPDWKLALMGANDEQAGGRVGVALHQLYPPEGRRVPPDNEAFGPAAVAHDNAVFQNPELVAVSQDWSACMNDLGYTKADGAPFTFPVELGEAILARRPDGGADPAATPPAAEIEVALDDWNCQEQVRYVDRLYGRLQQLTADFAVEHSDLIVEIAQWHTDVATRAQAAIDQAPQN